ncbi:hypothetical protein NXS98_15710 [Fontisphaera persica]|uniref:hypothetical protein n=1 Tax=Fontisphaera persica TaxID=2974023 RepID=UPI0024BFFD0E|nr:hypothetical protein [Fontisphaera persica]WCJ59145.1 hypothetical protein NXS98_15710 [Fontisphaera persica]
MEEMRIVVFMLLLALALGAGGCRKRAVEGEPSRPAQKKSARGKKGPAVTPDLALQGRVARVSPQARTVVLSFPLGWLPALERRLNVYRQGVKVGEVKITGPQMDTNIAADLIAGEAAVGDEVRED